MDWANMPVNLRSPADTGKQATPGFLARIPGADERSGPGQADQQLHPVLRQARTEPAAGPHRPGVPLVDHAALAASRPWWPRIDEGTDFVATNVPGPPIPVFAGAQVLRMLPSSRPQAGAAVNCALMSYNGVAQVGVNIDTTHPGAQPTGTGGRSPGHRRS